ncbi:EF-hand calcium-binding domain-containing protein 4B-like [Amphibalanus amphitrite]|uniref:EF-hand calcium-binding domain-containing protein 4B-like n=1 Tax=Amphibalanus amphitrite TaxID=1232801 RepID=UPI001C927ED0|nr:EF-hand calcium-binding domain-containing protein 4B-like [Amphibalanus amphitrite]
MAATEGSMKEVLTQKAHELFALCDRENKGFIGKRDMQRMIQELPLEPDQLEDVFDSLDVDGNGFLTLEEFTAGFGSFLGLDEADGEEPSSEDPGRTSEDRGRRTAEEEEEDEEERFTDFLVQAGATELLEESEAALRQMWRRLQQEETHRQQEETHHQQQETHRHQHADQQGPALTETFGRLLGEIAARERRARSEQETLETALKHQQETMQSQMKSMFEEMEAQIASERGKSDLQEEQRQAKIREDLEAQVAIKELEAQMARQRLTELTEQLAKVTSSDAQQRQEIAQLQKQKDSYESEVVRQQQLIADLQAAAEQSRALTREERRKRAMAAFNVTENIATEREDLVKQLDLLRTINTKLMDERDSGMETGKTQSRQERGDSLANIKDLMGIDVRHNDQQRNGPARSPERSPVGGGLLVPDGVDGIQESDCEVDEVYFENNPDVVQRVPVIPLSPAYKGPLPLRGDPASLLDELLEEQDMLLLEEQDMLQPLPSAAAAPGAGSETDDTHTLQRHRRRNRSHHGDRHHSSTLLIYHQGQMAREAADHPSPETPGNSLTRTHRENSPTPSAASTVIQPQRVYKVVIIGDAGVGKSSFVQRSCTGEVRPSYAATIGVDFQVQTVVIEDQTVCIQLWDTAGQERFRSITKQYFRKADGVFVMFDVTSETSFRNCRQWIQDVKELSAEETALILLGNKTDLCPDPQLRVVKPDTAAMLASDCGALYNECSALQDVGVGSVMELMAELLLQKEDGALERALTLLPDQAPRKGCCKK